MVIDDLNARARFGADALSKVSLFESHRLFADLYCLRPGQSQRVHTHEDDDKIYYVLEGEVLVQVGTDEHTVRAGGLAIAGAGEPHGVRNASDGEVLMLVVMAPHPKPPAHPAS